ncbi:hypothetical protein COCSUDRAFT_47107 [Coccomyxa subellipsoidea C-169]|uniref:Uncharacterized protein n=1 Tax=Coccomyxa subellipsoidea (strain C-169) TaxID=574566 RepID=I0Z059_COCSC|nr:hypothetical protein COCSUDRAFT_47107 [Coccomyxa subellipsoidea C-169]EIE24028.1 hypothetical protein COCSUDRAFT_47107 [Coccomyxa subellipsoidea C-169]|eukprot:XP_005648572.1 hypothetical protein COCSUDRAFT_47107 [Coccomyxa subellipsoidea C-169]
MLAGTSLQSSYNAAVNILRKAANAGSVKLGTEPVAADVPLQSALDHSRSGLEKASHMPATQQWLKPQLDSSEGTEKMYSLLEQHIEHPEFLKKLERAKDKAAAAPGKHGDEVLHKEWWEAPPGGISTASADSDGFTEVTRADIPENEALESYVMVQKDDVLEAIGTFVAAYLAELPEAQNLPPAQLQAALKTAFKELRKGRVRRLWEWGRTIYRVTAFSYGAFSVYENPWLVRALLAAMWTACRMMLRAGTGLPV